MSSNKMGGVPSNTRSALYRMLERVDDQNDAEYAAVIDKLTELGPQRTLERIGH